MRDFMGVQPDGIFRTLIIWCTRPAPPCILHALHIYLHFTFTCTAHLHALHILHALHLNVFNMHFTLLAVCLSRKSRKRSRSSNSFTLHRPRPSLMMPGPLAAAPGPWLTTPVTAPEPICCSNAEHIPSRTAAMLGRKPSSVDE